MGDASTRKWMNGYPVYEIYMTKVSDSGNTVLGDKIDETLYPKQACLLIDTYRKNHGWNCTMVINEK